MPAVHLRRYGLDYTCSVAKKKSRRRRRNLIVGVRQNPNVLVDIKRTAVSNVVPRHSMIVGEEISRGDCVNGDW
jgi:hypothetical protein